ncbi:MAG TPA: guanylate kinase [Gemmatimonadaceae bacterium]|nr:guanylate kinase [Gemmatimonadaceae bacterium]
MSAFPVILSSPSGGGKTTISRRILSVREDVGYSVSCTTRPRRPGEVDGRDYYFLTRPEFARRRDAGDFAESAEVHGNLYGTLRVEIERVLGSGRHVIMDIDVQGAAQIRHAFPSSVAIFILPPSGPVLLDRLRNRHTESQDELAKRLRSALNELREVDRFEYVIVNDSLDDAIRRVGSIIDAEVVRRYRVAGLSRQVAELTACLEAELHPPSS